MKVLSEKLPLQYGEDRLPSSRSPLFLLYSSWRRKKLTDANALGREGNTETDKLMYFFNEWNKQIWASALKFMENKFPNYQLIYGIPSLDLTEE